MNKPVRIFVLTAAVLVIGLASMAQTPPSGAWISGVVESIGSGTMTVQGLTLNVQDGATFLTVAPDGSMARIPFGQVLAGDFFRGRILLVDGVQTTLGGTIGDAFFWHGVVTAVTPDGSGGLVSLQLDGVVTVYASQARTVNLSGGSTAIQVGSTVGVRGIVTNGVFAAQWINTGGVDFRSAGTIQSLTSDDSGNVAGFTLAYSGGTVSVDLDPTTIIWKHRRQVDPSTLETGMRVKVTGWTLPDGSVQAWTVKILKN